MTAHRSFKRLVRARMDRTGESYTAARRILLAAREPADGEPGAAGTRLVLSTSDERIRERTGRGWEEWFDLLDDWGAADRTHRETARWVAELQGVDPLAWNAQAVVGSYERARRGRAVGQHPDGFRVTASRTVAVAAERLFDAVLDERARAGWLPDAPLRTRTATRPRSARFDWADGSTRVTVTIDARDAARSTITVEHARIADAAAAQRRKAWWRERLAALKAQLEAGGSDA